jgi:spore coat protein U-like protein
MKKILVLTSLLLTTWVKEARAQTLLDCGLSLSVDNIVFSWTGNSLVYTANLTLERTNTSNRCRKFEVGFSTGVSGNYNRTMVSGSEVVSYNIFQDNTSNVPLKTLADASGNSETISIKMKNNEFVKSTTFEGRLTVPNLGRTVLPKGNYTDLITATARPDRNNVVSTNRNFQVSLNIPAEIDISLVNSGGVFDPTKTSFTMDFNVISVGDTREVDLKVKSNAGYSLSLSSQHGGSIKHQTGNYTIPYQMKVNGGIRQFSGPGVPLVIGTGTGNTPASGVNFSISMEIGDPSNKLAGPYEDVITVTATSND